MICWSITAHAASHPDEGILDAGASETFAHACRSAGAAAFAALTVIADEHPQSSPFVTISVDDAPLLLACAGQDAAGQVDLGQLLDAVIQVGETGVAHSSSVWGTDVGTWPA